MVYDEIHIHAPVYHFTSRAAPKVKHCVEQCLMIHMILANDDDMNNMKFAL